MFSMFNLFGQVKEHEIKLRDKLGNPKLIEFKETKVANQAQSVQSFLNQQFKGGDKTEFRPSNSLAQIKSTLSESQKFHQYYNGGAKLLSVAHGSGGSGGGGISFTGSSGDSSNIGINIYPNPANDYLYIVFQDNSPRNIKLFNFQGVLIKNLTPKSNILDIDVTLLPNGIYHLEIHQGAEKIIEKIIVQH